MTKLLIAGGCSITDQEYDSYKKHGIFTWPHLVAEEMGWDYLNVGKAGHGNDTIENNVYDAIIENQDREIVVAALWTETTRQSLFDIDRINPSRPCPNLKDLNEYKDRLDFLVQYVLKLLLKYSGMKNDSYNIDKKIVDKSFRHMDRTYRFCKMMGIEQFHEIAIPWHVGTPWMQPFWRHDELNSKQKEFMVKRVETLEEYVSEHSVIKKLDIQHWPNENPGLIDWYTRDKLLPCSHPNQESQYDIARAFLDKIKND
jgi:hypothetical protein